MHDFAQWTDNSVVGAAMRAAHVTEAKFNWPVALISLGGAVVAVAVTFVYYELHAFAGLHELTERSKPARAGYDFLENKYYLDTLYEDGIVRAIKRPDRPGQRTGSTRT